MIKTLYLAAGTLDGQIVIWDYVTGKIHSSISTGQSKSVLLEFLDSKTIVFSSGLSLGYVDIEGGAKSIKFLENGKKETTSLCVHDGKIFAGSLATTFVYDKSTFQLIARVQSSDVKLIACDQDIVLVAATSHFLNLYQLGLDKTVTSSLVVSLPDKPVGVDLKCHDNGIDIVVVTSKGTLVFFKIANLSEKGVKPLARIHLKSGLVMSAKLTEESNVVIAGGTGSEPSFRRLNFLEENGGISLTKKDVSDEIQVVDEKTKVSGRINSEVPTARFAQIVEQKELEVSDDILEENDDVSVQNGKNPGLNLSRSLMHALKHKDNETLTKCLLQSNVQLIKDTVLAMEKEYASKLLEGVIDRYQRGFLTNFHLVNWVRPVLMNYASHILSNPKLLEQLSPLYHSINSRLTTFNTLLDVSGRLDFVLGLAGHKMVGFKDDDDVDTDISSAPTPKTTVESIQEDDINEEDFDENLDEDLLYE